MAYLRLLVNQNDDSALLRIINIPKREIGPGDTREVGYFKEKQISLFEAIFDFDLIHRVNSKSYNSLQKICSLD